MARWSRIIYFPLRTLPASLYASIYHKFCMFISVIVCISYLWLLQLLVEVCLNRPLSRATILSLVLNFWPYLFWWEGGVHAMLWLELEHGAAGALQYPIQGLQQALGGNPIRPHPGNRSVLKTSLTFSLEVARIDIIICVLLEIGQIQFN
jgi:hypothetical protein